MPNIQFTEQELEELANKLADKLFVKLKERLNQEEELLTLEQACDYLKCNKSWLYKKVQQKEIPFVKVGKYLRFKKKELDRWMK